MIGDKLRPVLILLVLSCTVIGGLSCVFANSDSNITDVGTGINTNNNLNTVNSSGSVSDINTSTLQNNNPSDVGVNQNNDSLTVSSSSKTNLQSTASKNETKSSNNKLASSVQNTNITDNNGYENNSNLINHVDSVSNDSNLASTNLNQTVQVSNITLNESFLITDDFEEVYGEGLNYTVRLIDANGNPIIGQHIALNLSNPLNGLSKVYWATTDILGYAFLQINLYPGNYNVKATYYGNDIFSSVSNELNEIIVYNPGEITNTTNNTIDSSNNTDEIIQNNTLSVSDILNISHTVSDYINNNHKLPEFVTINGQNYTLSQYAYFLTSALLQLQNGSDNSINIENISQPAGSINSTVTGTLTISQVISMANRINNYMLTNGLAPAYDSSNGLGQISYENYIYVFSKTLAFYQTYNRLPNTVSVNSSVFNTNTITNVTNNTNSGIYENASVNSTINITTSTTNSGINDLNTKNDTSAYLSATTNCEVNNAAIQSLAKTLTAGLNNDLDKAMTIYNYVRDEISYSYYANTKYGALGTLNKGYGNCVDQASLVIALFRAAGLQARYVHGKNCVFRSGLVTGHVWAQVLVDGVWYAADCTSRYNSLGTIVNWNTNSFNLASISASISF